MKMQQVGVITNNPANFNNRTKQVSFKRDWNIHNSWGAVYKEKIGKTNFKLLSFPDAKAVFVEVADKAITGISNIKERIVQVLAAAGATLAIHNIMPKDDSTKIYPMENKGNGIYTAVEIDATPDDKYRYIVVTKDDNVNIVKDPYAKKQESIHGWSSIYNPDNYEWKNTGWLEGKDPRRIVRDPKDERFHGLSRMIIEEINIPTITADGTFKSAQKAVDDIAKAGIANTIEIMPVENTYSKQWGYDGVDKFAINEKLGTHAELKELIDYAHGKGLNVIIDIVPNHIGPDGDYLSETGPYETELGRFGAKLNYEFENNKYVRDWMANAALWWANEFKVDGIRLDMTKETASDYLLKQIVDELNEHNPMVFLIAEDGRNNKLSVTRYDDNESSHEEKINTIDMLVDFISKGTKTTPHAIGFDSEWDFPFMHAIKDAIIYNNQASIGTIDDTMKTSAHRVKYILSHDEIGNIDGTRLVPKIMDQYLHLFDNIEGISNTDRDRKAANLSQKLLIAITTNKDITDTELENIQCKYGMRYIYDKNMLVNSIKAALAKSRLAAGTIMTIPGPKMFFQGEDYGDLSYFKFFRDFSPEFESNPSNFGLTEKVNAEKGYNTSNEYALKESVMNQYKPAGKFADMQEQMFIFNKDLVQLIDNNIALQDGELKSVYKDYNNLIHIHSVEKGNNKLLIIKNFADKFHDKNYNSPGFPQNETYTEVFNSDDIKYGGGGNTNKNREFTSQNQAINLAANSIVILKKI